MVAQPSPADNNDMGRTIGSIVTGIVVGVLTGIATAAFVEAAMWSPAHGGTSDEITLSVLSLVAMAVPLVCGFLAGSAIYRSHTWRGTNGTTESIHLDCPHCGCSMNRSAKDSTQPYTVVECPIHGPFHFSPNTDVTLGPPPQA